MIVVRSSFIDPIRADIEALWRKNMEPKTRVKVTIAVEEESNYSPSEAQSEFMMSVELENGVAFNFATISRFVNIIAKGLYALPKEVQSA